jgi:hypothetical protein
MRRSTAAEIVGARDGHGSEVAARRDHSGAALVFVHWR